jgi:uncharacterized protein (TIGR02246 family)
MTKRAPKEIAAAFMSKYEDLWNSNGARAAANLYTPDSLLVGYCIAIGRTEIEKLLGMIFNQGWTKISIKVVEAREFGDVVLVANEYSAEGSGPSTGKTLNGKSSYVLANVGNTWLSAMHAAT